MADDEAVVRQAYESFLRNDREALFGLFDPDIRWTVPRMVPQGGEFNGIDQVHIFFHGLRAAWKPLRLELETLGQVGPGLVTSVVGVSGTLAGSPVSYGAVHLFTVAGGRITRFREFLDLDAVLAG